MAGKLLTSHEPAEKFGLVHGSVPSATFIARAVVSLIRVPRAFAATLVSWVGITPDATGFNVSPGFRQLVSTRRAIVRSRFATFSIDDPTSTIVVLPTPCPVTSI